MSSAENPTIIDVRTPAEFAGGDLEGAVNLDFQSENFEEELATLDPSAEYLVHCQAGGRSAKAFVIMGRLGFDHVRDIGGLGDAASDTGRDIVTDES